MPLRWSCGVESWKIQQSWKSLRLETYIWESLEERWYLKPCNWMSSAKRGEKMEKGRSLSKIKKKKKKALRRNIKIKKKKKRSLKTKS